MVTPRILATTLCLLASTAAFAADPLPPPSRKTSASPANGWPDRRDAESRYRSRPVPGAVIAIARHGKLVALDAYGWRDKAAGVAMTTDTIFNIASMTSR